MNPEVIKKCKENPLPFGQCSKEVRKCFREVGKENCRYYEAGDYWCNNVRGEEFYPDVIYQIKPDYQPPEEQVERCEVEIEDSEIFFARAGRNHCLDIAIRDANLIGFEYEDGTILGNPRWYISKDKPALTPKYVLFKKEK